MSTDAYQRQSRSRSEFVSEPFIASCPQRLRADQLFNSIVKVLGIDEAAGFQQGNAYVEPKKTAAADLGDETKTGIVDQTKTGDADKTKTVKKPDEKRKRQREGQGPRGNAVQTFGYDPSEERDDVAGSIPQALWLMNAPMINQSISSSPTLARLLDQEHADEAVTVELYLRALAREPKTAEMKTCLAYVQAAASRQEAFEDILWSLINSTEFLYRK